MVTSRYVNGLINIITIRPDHLLESVLVNVFSSLQELILKTYPFLTDLWFQLSMHWQCMEVNHTSVKSLSEGRIGITEKALHNTYYGKALL